MADPISMLVGAALIGGVAKLMERFVNNNPPKETDGWVIKSARWTAIKILPSVNKPAKQAQKSLEELAKEQASDILKDITGK